MNQDTGSLHLKNVDPFILDTDASDVAIGTALYQLQNGIEHPLGDFVSQLQAQFTRWHQVSPGLEDSAFQDIH